MRTLSPCLAWLSDPWLLFCAWPPREVWGINSSRLAWMGDGSVCMQSNRLCCRSELLAHNFKCVHKQCIYYTPHKRSWEGVYWFHPVHLSVCPPSIDMILSTHILRNWCMDSSENVYTVNSPSEIVHLEFSYWF